MTIEADTTRTFTIRRWDVLRIALGILLLTAAGLKLAGMQVSGIPRVGWFASVPVQLAAAEWELALGLWLLSGAYRTASWLLALATFVVFACISGYLGWIGVASCGCFGTIKASPWWAFGVDVTAVLSLGAFRPALLRPSQAPNGNLHRQLRVAGGFAMAVAGLFAIIAATGSFAFGSMEAGLARLRGETLIVEPSYLDFGVGKVGQTLTAKLTVRNWTDRPVRVIGGTSDCSCVAISDLPLTIGPGESRAISIELRVKKAEAGMYTRFAQLRTDSERRQSIEFLAGCQVTD